MRHEGLYVKYIKRGLDVVFSLLAIVVFSPVLLLCALLVRLRLGSPVVFQQVRPGKNERFFYLRKFRSMTDETGADGRLLPDVQRLTRFGRFLRSSSLDELLELVNILRGDMSFVGPRPLSIYYLPHYPPSFRRRHDVRPGLTGLAQVNGRNNLPWDDRFEMDVRYVDSVSFLLDVRIILDTILKVLKQTDVSVRGTSIVKDYGPYCVLKNEGKNGEQLMGMTYSEIGSYWWLDSVPDKAAAEPAWLPKAEDAAFTFSGRNAIDLALRDILKERPVRRVFAPSYSCVSMLQAFADRGIPVLFYQVSFQEGRFVCETPKVREGDVVLVMSYFGLDPSSAHKAIAELRGAGAIVIEDITHSLLREDCASPYSDYLTASLRKWLGIPAGGWLGKARGALAEKPSLNGDSAVSEKIDAMKEKYDYLCGKLDSKEHFLLAQAKFDNDLIHVDRLLGMDEASRRILGVTEIAQLKERRRHNAKTLLDALRDIPGIELPRFDVEKDVPLFLPVMMETAERDSLRQFLIDRGIYCPIHWPELMGAPAGIRERELSLICDQRYSEGDMEAIAAAVRAWRAQQ